MKYTNIDNKDVKEVEDRHLQWFKKTLIETGAPATMSDLQTICSSVFSWSELAFIAGYVECLKKSSEILGKS